MAAIVADMRCTTHASILCLLLALIPSLAPAAERYRVTGNRVNLRSAAEPTAKVVIQAAEGDILTGHETDGEWLAVDPPKSADAWIYSELVKDGVVAASKVRVRAGAGLNYKPIGQLDKGDRVVVRGSLGEWLKIEPTEGTRLWISRDYAALVVPPPPAVAPITPPPSEPVAARKPPMPDPSRMALAEEQAGSPSGRAGEPALPPEEVDVALPVTLVKGQLVTGLDQGRAARISGSLHRTLHGWRRPSRYRLVQRDEQGRSVIVCYVLGDKAQLNEIVGSRVTLTGRKYVVQGVRYPVLVPEQIIRGN